MIKRTLTEKKVLKKLGIPDFRHMTKDKIIAFASMLPKMDPEVAKKALEQFPEYAKAVLQLVGIYKEELDAFVASNNESIKSVYDAYSFVLEKISKELEDPNLTFEQKEAINERLIQVAGMMDALDAKNKSFLLKMVGEITACLLFAGGLLVLALGGNMDLSGSKPDEHSYLNNDSNDHYLS